MRATVSGEPMYKEPCSISLSYPCPTYGRGWNAVLTDAGFAALTESWPIHLASVRRHVLGHVQGEDLSRLTAVLQRIATAT